MNTLTLQAPAKINWTLDIVGKRADGYHLLRSLMQSIDLCDRVTLAMSTTDSCSCSPLLQGGGENIALKAWQLLKAEYDLPGGLAIQIQKTIPEGAGLAGGSTNAAAVLHGVNRLFQLGLSTDQLAALAVRIGADLPFCLNGGLALVEGIGEIVQPLSPAPSYSLVVVYPGFAASTAAVYRAFCADQVAAHPDLPALQRALLAGDHAGISAHAANLLELPAFSLFPEIAAVKARCRDLGLPALMSGSGSSVWVLAKSREEADTAAAWLGQFYPFAVAVNTIATGPVCC